MTDKELKIVNELEFLLSANPEVSIIDKAEIIIPRSVDQLIKRSAIQQCLNVVKKVINDGI